MNGRTAKKIRREVNKATKGQWDKMWEAVYEAPLRRRLRIAWHVMRGR